MIHKLHWWALTLCKWARALGGMSKCKSYHCLRAFHPNKNISLLHGLNRDPQDIFFKSQPGKESKDHLPGEHSWLTERQRSVLHPQKPSTHQLKSTVHTQLPPSEESIHEWEGLSNTCNIQVWPLRLPAHLSSMSLQVWSKHRSSGFRRLHWSKSWGPDPPEVWLSHIHLCHLKLTRSSCSAKWL